VVDVELFVDRPFIFLIRDTATGSMLFLGRLLAPVEQK
jgi:serine protease inhibitor